MHTSDRRLRVLTSLGALGYGYTRPSRDAAGGCAREGAQHDQMTTPGGGDMRGRDWLGRSRERRGGLTGAAAAAVSVAAIALTAFAAPAGAHRPPGQPAPPRP